MGAWEHGSIGARSHLVQCIVFCHWSCDAAVTIVDMAICCPSLCPSGLRGRHSRRRQAADGGSQVSRVTNCVRLPHGLRCLHCFGLCCAAPLPDPRAHARAFGVAWKASRVRGGVRCVACGAVPTAFFLSIVVVGFPPCVCALAHRPPPFQLRCCGR